MRVLGSRGWLLGIFGIHDWVFFKCMTTVKSRREMILQHNNTKFEGKLTI